jgi:nitroreductase
MEFEKLLKMRRSVRKYGLRKVTFQQVGEICNAATFSPMAGNIYSVRFIVVSTKKKIKALAGAAEQPFIAQAPFVVVVYSDPLLVKKSYGSRATMYVRQQAGAAIENMLLRAADIGLGSCWIGWFDEEIVKRIVRLPDNVQVEALLPIGHPLEKHVVKKKPDLKLITYFEDFKQETMPKEIKVSP